MSNNDQWQPTSDGKGSWRLVGEYRLVVKQQDYGDSWWWGCYEAGDDGLLDEGIEPDEMAAREAAEDGLMA